MNVQVLTPVQKVFDGDATGIQLPGVKGSFEILNNHAPLIAALGEGTLRINTGKEEQVIQIASGFVEVLNNQVVVLVEGASS